MLKMMKDINEKVIDKNPFKLFSVDYRQYETGS